MSRTEGSIMCHLVNAQSVTGPACSIIQDIFFSHLVELVAPLGRVLYYKTHSVRVFVCY